VKKARRFRPLLEKLEDRWVPTGNFQPIGAFPAIGVGPTQQPSIIFTIGNNTVTTTLTPGQGAFDGSDDAYVGVKNLAGSGVNLSSLNLSGPSGFTNFEGDGIGITPNPTSHLAGAPGGPFGTGVAGTYVGPGTSFSNFTATGTSLTVNFSDNSGNPLTPGNQTYFSLELAPSALNLLIAVPPPNQTAVEGASQAFNLGAFTASGAGPWTVTVNWGDSSPNTVFTQTTKGTIDGSAAQRTHTYAEEGAKTVTVTVTGNGQTSTESFGVTVTDPAVLGTPVAVSAVEGTAFTGKTTATFTDPGGAETIPGNYTATINWGDSTPTITATITGGTPVGSTSAVFTVGSDGIAHTYKEEGTYTVTTVITHLGDSTTTVTSTATVTDPAVLGTGVPVSAVEGAAFTGKTTATFTDPGGAETIPGNYTATINWGDSTPTITATITGGTPVGSTSAVFTVGSDGIAHTYKEEGTYTVTTTITHSGGTPFATTTVVTSTATVSDPAVVATGVNVSAKEAIAFSLPVATFTDPGGAETIPGNYSATINWGDSSPNSAGTITGGTPLGSKTAVFTVTGTHTYAEEGTFTITTTITHSGGTPFAVTTTTTSTAHIRDNFGLLVLDPTDPSSLMITGNGAVVVNHSGAVVVDSTDPSAIFLAGNHNATLAAAETDVAAAAPDGLVMNGNPTFLGELNHEAATPDPINLPLPPMPAVASTTPVHISSGTVTLTPGKYIGGIAIDGTASVTLSPGVYYMAGGGFSVSGQATVSGTGVLLVNAPVSSSDTISITGGAVVTLTASNTLPDGFTPYDGIAIMQDPASFNTILVAGNADGTPNLTVTGTVYAKNALLQVDGQGNMVVSAFTGAFSTVGGVVVVFQAQVNGGADLTINADPPRDGGGALINFDGIAARGPVVVPPSGAARLLQPIAPVVGTFDFASAQAFLAPNGLATLAPMMVAGTQSPTGPGVLLPTTQSPAVVFNSGNYGGAVNIEESNPGDLALVPIGQQPAPLAPATPAPVGKPSSLLPVQAYDAMLAARAHHAALADDGWAPAGIIDQAPAAVDAGAAGKLTPALALGLALALPSWWRGPRQREDDKVRQRPSLK
jgi:PKD repeat protein